MDSQSLFKPSNNYRKIDKWIAENITKEYINFPKEYTANTHCAIDLAMKMKDLGYCFDIGCENDGNPLFLVSFESYSDGTLGQCGEDNLSYAICKAAIRAVDKNGSGIHFLELHDKEQGSSH